MRAGSLRQDKGGAAGNALDSFRRDTRHTAMHKSGTFGTDLEPNLTDEIGSQPVREGIDCGRET